MKANTKYLLSIYSALAIIIIAVYFPVLNFKFVLLDDGAYITNNNLVATGITGKNVLTAFSYIQTCTWHPITWLSHMADVQLYGMNPGGHHLTNLIIHIFSSLLLLHLLFRSTGSLWQSTFVAALFALHPLHVESVAWVSERKDVLSAFFWFLSLVIYVDYVKRPQKTLYILCLIFFILGLMSKPMLVTLPMIMLLMDIWPLNRCRYTESDHGARLSVSGIATLVKEKIPFFACSLVMGIVTIYTQHKAGAVLDLSELPTSLRIENALVAYVTYIVKTLFPHDLAVLYPIPSSFPLLPVICSLLFLLFTTAISVRFGRRYPYIAVGWFWFIITLLPVIGLIQVGAQSMADRYSYIPVTGLFIIIAWGAAELSGGFQYRKQILAVLAGTAIIASAVLTRHQLMYWRDSFSLFQHTLQITNNNYVIHHCLGSAIAEKGDHDAAIIEYNESIRINPNYAEAHNSLGNELIIKGNLDAAIREFRLAFQIRPDLIEAHSGLGIALAGKGDYDAAIKENLEVLRNNPDFAPARINMGVLYAKKGNDDAAMNEYLEALRINPNFAELHNDIGGILLKRGDYDAAVKEFNESLRIDSNYINATKNLEVALFLKKKHDEAVK